ncbi:potassium transporter 7-like isoform X3 [Asparagus officinalis]|uniref:potassium transporter 7-like isoform X3 n=1 Tax=Asparagus officinalis TaxID=4686 RepID=UPI00098E1369|nr:potassium transporter 7-like isoform X3 [Asparagus officinalis]
MMETAKVRIGSRESRWISRESVEDEEEDHAREEDQEDGEGVERKLIRTTPVFDPLDVEANEVSIPIKDDLDQEFNLRKSIILALQTLGVVFGDIGTSPLYTFDVMFSKSPYHRKEDVIGALSLVLYTLILIPLIKYILVVLWGNDDGEGGTFALYSLICRHAKVSLLPNQLHSDTRISKFGLKLPSPELDRSLRIKEHIESSLGLKKLLLVLVLFGTSMMIANGVVTPTMSVMSAVGGLRVGISSFEQDKVVMISVAFLVILFSVQKYVTSKVDLAVGPALFIWFCSLGLIGIYNLVEYGGTAFLAFNPVYIHYFFKRNSTRAWMSLGGCILCATGIAELGVMIVTTILVTLIMLLIWQINLIIVMCFAVLFLGLELVFVSSVLCDVGDGSWVLLVFTAILFMMMNIWNYGSRLKYQTEVRQKLPMDLLMNLGCNLGTIRAPGIGLVYNELVKGVPAVFGHFLTSLPAIHSLIVFVSIKYIPVPVVPQGERFLFRRVCPQSYHMFRCIARYGYKDVRKENHHTFEQLLIQSLENFIRREAQELSLASDDDADSDTEIQVSNSRVIVASNGIMYSLSIPLLANEKPASEPSTSSSHLSRQDSPSAAASAEKNLERELALLYKAKEIGPVYLLGHGDIRARKDSWFFKKLIINYFYAFLRKNSRRGTANLSIPHSHLMQVSMTYMV